MSMDEGVEAQTLISGAVTDQAVVSGPVKIHGVVICSNGAAAGSVTVKVGGVAKLVLTCLANNTGFPFIIERGWMVTSDVTVTTTGANTQVTIFTKK